MSGYVGILVSDPWLQNQFTQVELRSLKTHVRKWVFFSFFIIIIWICTSSLETPRSFMNLYVFVFCVCGDDAVYEHEEREWESDTGRAGVEDVSFESGWRESHWRRESFVHPWFLSWSSWPRRCRLRAFS